ncbi:phosphotransferase family protein [Mycobacterium sp. 1245852.3]|uniref:phosphotransferase family protein n=1 Tax=Mycobacterium sp. 1245852.3 TaxID=1856860 RepID=UPI0009EDFB7B
MNHDLPGLDLVALQSFLDDHRPNLIQGELDATLVAGGRSNLTYEVTDGTSSWIVRRPPLGHVLATAHNMRREYQVITALRHSGVPVPATIVLCEDSVVLGAPFFVMEKVTGETYRRADQLLPLGAVRTRTVCERMVDTLVVLHAVDPQEVGLGDFGRPEGFVSRQVNRWKSQLDASHSRDVAKIEALHTKLISRIPPTATATIVHGDYRLDNLLVDHDDAIAAVLDWEMATLGDPFTDVALLMAYITLSGLDGSDAVTDAGSAAGFLSPDQVLARYRQVSGRDAADMGFYLAFAYFKLAVILEGIHFRFTQGKTVGSGFDRIGPLVEPLAIAGHAALQEI